MRGFTAGELAAMQAAQEEAMQDTCAVLSYSEGSADVYGMPAPTYTAGEPIVCGLDTGRGRREAMERGEVPLADAVVRLPVGTSLDARDRIRITHRFGVAIIAETYELVSTPQRGPSGLVCMLKRVTE